MKLAPNNATDTPRRMGQAAHSPAVTWSSGGVVALPRDYKAYCHEHEAKRGRVPFDRKRVGL